MQEPVAVSQDAAWARRKGMHGGGAGGAGCGTGRACLLVLLLGALGPHENHRAATHVALAEAVEVLR